MVSTYRYLRNSFSKLFASPIDYEFLDSTDAEKVKKRLLRGYDVNQPITDWKFHDYEAIRPIHFACARGTPEVVSYLLDYGAQVDDETNSGLYPIHFAVIHKKVRIIDELMNNSADANVQDNKGYTPLHYAVETKNLGAIKRLLKNHGADPYIRNNQSNDILTMAEQKSLKHIVQYLKEWESQKECNHKIQKVLTIQDDLSKDVKKVNQKVDSMHDQIKKEICDELRGDIQMGFARLETTRQMHINNQISICSESGYSSQMSLAGKACVQGSVPSLIMQYENLSSSVSLSVARSPQERKISKGKCNKKRPEIQERKNSPGSDDGWNKSSSSSDIGDEEQQNIYDNADNDEMEQIRYVLRRNFIYLESSMKARPIVNYLFQEGVIGMSEKEHLAEGLKTESDRCEYLIKEVLWKASPKDFRIFLEGLEDRGQPHIAERIRNTDTSRMYNRRTPGTLYNVPPSAAQSEPLFSNLTRQWKSMDTFHI